MLSKRIWICAAVLLLAAVAGNAAALTDQEQLGRNLFFDTNLSEPPGQGCVSCHDPAVAFTDPDKDRGVSQGVIIDRFGNRNAPTAMYKVFSPDFAFIAGEFIGGQFWDQRAANLTEQAKGPFLNPLEMNNPPGIDGEALVLSKILPSSNGALFTTVCGVPNLNDPADVDLKYTCMASAIAAFEKTPELNSFTSKYDQDMANFTVQEKRGLKLFNRKGGCFVCHAIGAIPQTTVFTDFDAHNIGVPSNLGMMGDGAALQAYFPFYYPPLAPQFNPAGLSFVDTGLAGNPRVPAIFQPVVRGVVKVPTLRNVNKTAPYMHNGVFRDLKTVVHFYNTRDALGNCANTAIPNPGVNCWPAPEVPQNKAVGIGTLDLTDAEENDIVAFLKTLDDGYVPQPQTSVLTPQEQLGRDLFFDTSLSTPTGQGCVSCHDPSVAFTDLEKTTGVSQGANTSRFGNRNAPSNMYSDFSPDFAPAAGGFIGGQFWDERAANLTEQAKGPFLNPLEMNNTNEVEVLNKIQASGSAALFTSVCGTPDLNNQTDVQLKYTCMADAIAAFESTPELNKFSSKFDTALSGLTIQELRGMFLFNGKGACAVCHGVGPTPQTTLFTDFDAENIGVPSNLGMMGDTADLQAYFPFYYPPLVPQFNPAGLKFADVGLGGNPNVPAIFQPVATGKMKAPTLRNVNLTAPYMHNGVFRDLPTVVHFYNTRDILGNCAGTANPNPGVNCWPAPEEIPNMNTIIGNLQLTNREENDIVAFLKTLTDDGPQAQPAPFVPTPQEQLGRNLFLDTNLSTPAGQGCVSCHDPALAFTEPNKDRAVSAGATVGRFGKRNAPSMMYAAFSPHLSLVGGVLIGGQFWDQRAANLTEYAKAPFLNPLEMNNTGPVEVLSKIQASGNAGLFDTVCGVPDLGNQADVELKYTCMANAIAAFVNTPELVRFSSKFDLDPANLTLQEKNGLVLFAGKGNCAVCHPIGAIPTRSLFTDFDAENIGVPSNLGMMGNTPALQHYFPFYYPPIAPAFNPAGLNFADLGQAGNPNVPANLQPLIRGIVKAPTLRNVELTAPYMHNGVFRTLKEVVHFYNTRDVLGNCHTNQNPQPGVNCWPAPEVASNMNTIIGNLQLTDAEENDIVAFLKTLTDVPLKQGGDITGRVTDAAGSPVTAVVTEGTRNALIDAQGNYSLVNLAPGTYTVTASAAGYNTGSASVTVTFGAIATQDFVLSPAPVTNGTIAGTVTDSSTGTAIAGSTVIAGSMTATTNAAGNYSISIAPGTYTVTASATGFITQSIPDVAVVSGATTTQDFALNPVLAVNESMVFNLNRGWNLISVPAFPENSSVAVALQNVQYNAIVGYDPATVTFATPTNMQPLYGYWINVTGDNQRIVINASKDTTSAPPGRNLYESWNLIGVSANRTDPASLAAGQLFMDLKQGPDPAQWLYTRLVSYDTSTPATYVTGADLTDATLLNQGHGYWLFIKNLPNSNQNNVPWAGKQW